MELDTAMAIRTEFPGPTYSDLHSLFLGISKAGIRFPQFLPSGGKWLRCFDAVQVNEDEFELLGREYGEPWGMAAEVVGPDLKLIAVTLGEGGSAYVAGAGFKADPMRWPETRARVARTGYQPDDHSGHGAHRRRFYWMRRRVGGYLALPPPCPRPVGCRNGGRE